MSDRLKIQARSPFQLESKVDGERGFLRRQIIMLLRRRQRRKAIAELERLDDRKWSSDCVAFDSGWSARNLQPARSKARRKFPNGCVM